MGNANYVSVAKPGVSGAVHIAPVGTSLPTSASAELAAAFKDMGYVSEDGITNTNTAETEKIKAFGGDVVHEGQTEKPDIWKYKLIESLNVEVHKYVYGNNNVEVNATTGEIKIKVSSEEAGQRSVVIDTILKNGALKRIVAPNTQISEIGDIVYKDNEPIGYEISCTAYPDANGYSHYEYILPGASGANNGPLEPLDGNNPLGEDEED